MPAADAIIARDGPVTAPMDYSVPAGAEIVPLNIAATFDGSGAAGAFVPALNILTPDGRQLGPYPLSAILAAGASARVSWFPGSLGGLGSGSLQRLCGARIQATSTQSVPDSSNTNLVYQSVLFDTDGMANLGSDNRILTVNTAGLYLVVCETNWSPNGAGRRINVALHNAFYTDASIPSVDSQADERPAVWNPIGAGMGRTSNTCVGLYQASVGDFFSSGAYQGSGAALNANGFANCFLAATLIGT